MAFAQPRGNKDTADVMVNHLTAFPVHLYDGFGYVGSLVPFESRNIWVWMTSIDRQSRLTVYDGYHAFNIAASDGIIAYLLPANFEYSSPFFWFWPTVE